MLLRSKSSSLNDGWGIAGNTREGGVTRQHRRSGLPALLQVHPAHICMARGGDVCCALCLWRPPCACLGRSTARCLGLPHHLVCQLRQPLLGLPGAPCSSQSKPQCMLTIYSTFMISFDFEHTMRPISGGLFVAFWRCFLPC